MHTESRWAGQLSERDEHGLLPLIYLHINSEGRFGIDLAKRINLGAKAA